MDIRYIVIFRRIISLQDWRDKLACLAVRIADILMWKDVIGLPLKVDTKPCVQTARYVDMER